MELWEVIARERIRDTIARYNWSGDSLRLEDLSSTFCEDGELAIRGQAPVRGRAAIVELLGGGTTDDETRRAAARQMATTSGKRRIVHHIVTNIRFVSVEPHEAHVEAYFTVFTEIGLDHYGRYRDTLVPAGDEWLIQHRSVSSDWHSSDSTMVRP